MKPYVHVEEKKGTEDEDWAASDEQWAMWLRVGCEMVETGKERGWGAQRCETEKKELFSPRCVGGRVTLEKPLYEPLRMLY